MNEKSLFHEEEEILRVAEELLVRGPLPEISWPFHYQELVSKYRRLLSHAKRLVNVGDLMQKDLNARNEQLKISQESEKRLLTQYQAENLERKRSEEEKAKLVVDLTEALAQVKKLSGLLPICASCKKIRDHKGYWTQMEAYIRDHSEAEFSHSICPDCARRLYPELYEKEPS